MATELRDSDAKSQNEYAVKDIYLAAFLHCLGYKVEYVRSSGYQSDFFFKDVPSGVIIAYFNDSPVKELSAKKLFDSFQNMRRISRQVRVIGGEEIHEDDE